jgi:hypothetical protein
MYIHAQIKKRSGTVQVTLTISEKYAHAQKKTAHEQFKLHSQSVYTTLTLRFKNAYEQLKLHSRSVYTTLMFRLRNAREQFKLLSRSL